MNCHTFKVTWPIHDDSLFPDEAIAEARRKWAGIAEQHQVTITGVPEYRVDDLNATQAAIYEASRAVVCEAPAMPRIPMSERRAT